MESFCRLYGNITFVMTYGVGQVSALNVIFRIMGWF